MVNAYTHIGPPNMRSCYPQSGDDQSWGGSHSLISAGSDHPRGGEFLLCRWICPFRKKLRTVEGLVVLWDAVKRRPGFLRELLTAPPI